VPPRRRHEPGDAADKMRVVRDGEERPFCAESNEACWAQHRRRRFLFTAR
jgi:outer membrane protein OmpA-like peptidoglycan-associated protein